MSLARRKRSSGHVKELTERARREGRELSRRRRAETRQLRPVFAPLRRFASWIAPYISGALMFVIKLFAALIALLAELGAVGGSWLAERTRAIARAAARWTSENVTPRSTVAFVAIAAAVGLGVSQFFDYHGVAVDAPNYTGEFNSVAPAPVVGTETAGSAHLWLLIPIAAAAVFLTVATYRGQTRLALGIFLCGLLGMAISLAIDLPQGLDAGRAGLAFSGSDAVLLQGFWAEVACSAMLMLCGGLLALYSRGVTAERRGGWRAGIAPGLRAES